MIETHVVNALLDTSMREGPLYAVLSFINGLVAPSFLFCAGFALSIVLRRRWEKFITLQTPLWRYIVRLLFILIVGYSLHLPYFSYTRMRDLSDLQSWSSFFQVDILQVIAVTLVALVLVALVTRKRGALTVMATSMAAIVVLVAPLVRNGNYSNLAIWLRPFLTTKVNSQFPLFPWSAFLIFGTVVGSWFLSANESGNARPWILRLVQLSIMTISAALLFEFSPITIYTEHDFWGPSPQFFFLRLGLVTLLLASFWWYTELKHPSAKSLLTIFGQESLLVYVAHLLIVYGQDYDWSLLRQFGPNLGYIHCLGIFASLTIAMSILAFCWRWMKAWNKSVANTVQYIVLGGMVFRFFTS